MKFLFSYYREKFLLGVLIVSLLIWALGASVLFLRVEPETILVNSTEYGLEVIGAEKSDSIFKDHQENFIRRFVAVYLNYDSKSFADQMAKSGDLMSQACFEKGVEGFNELYKKLSSLSLTQSAEIESITRIKPTIFDSVISVWTVQNSRDQKTRLKLTLELRKTQRNKQNPWGMEVVSVKEKRI